MNPEQLQQFEQMKKEITDLKSGRLDYEGQEWLKDRFFEKTGTQDAQTSITIPAGGGSANVTKNPNGTITLVFKGKRYRIPYYV